MLISGKSGSGKTEILRQTAKLCNSPFIKVEAVRYTEVGYHGDDVENIISDLFKKTKNEFHKNLKLTFWKLKSVSVAWENFILTYLLGKNYEKHPSFEIYREKLHSGGLDNLEVQIWLADKERIDKFKIMDIKNHLYRESFDKLSMQMDFDEIIKKNIEDRSIICIDEFDKLIKDVNYLFNQKKNVFASSKASDEGVQNDFLPLFDGTDVPITEGKKTQFYINTRNILFVALGAFSKNKPCDLIVEVQGRLPNQVEVKPLTREDYIKILKETKDNIIEQAVKSLKTEGIHLDFAESAIEEIANVSEQVNRNDDDTGARRLVSVLDTVLEDISFEAPEIYEEYTQPNKCLV
jgi:ATP-dependent HslUV protease ATP-binding subunit HslU